MVPLKLDPSPYVTLPGVEVVASGVKTICLSGVAQEVQVDIGTHSH